MWFGFYLHFGFIFYHATPKWPLSEFFNSLGYKRRIDTS